jgi:peptide deformylase
MIACSAVAACASEASGVLAFWMQHAVDHVDSGLALCGFVTRDRVAWA